MVWHPPTAALPTTDDVDKISPGTISPAHIAPLPLLWLRHERGSSERMVVRHNVRLSPPPPRQKKIHRKSQSGLHRSDLSKTWLVRAVPVCSE